MSDVAHVAEIGVTKMQRVQRAYTGRYTPRPAGGPEAADHAAPGPLHTVTHAAGSRRAAAPGSPKASDFFVTEAQPSLPIISGAPRERHGTLRRHQRAVSFARLSENQAVPPRCSFNTIADEVPSSVIEEHRDHVRLVEELAPKFRKASRLKLSRCASHLAANHGLDDVLRSHSHAPRRSPPLSQIRPCEAAQGSSYDCMAFMAAAPGQYYSCLVLLPVALVEDETRRAGAGCPRALDKKQRSWPWPTRRHHWNR